MSQVGHGTPTNLIGWPTDCPMFLVLFFWRENYIFTYSYMSFVQCITVLMALFID